jgi:hypothetical protein
VHTELALVKAIPSTDVKLFVPSDLGLGCDEQGARILVQKVKEGVRKAVESAGIPMTVVRPGGLFESSLAVG